MNNFNTQYIFQKEIAILKYDKPNLSAYRKKINTEYYFTCTCLPDTFKNMLISPSSNIRFLPKYQSNNIKIISMKILQLAFMKSFDSSEELLKKIKYYAYNINIRLDFIDIMELPTEYRKNYNDESFRKLLAEFFHFVGISNEVNKVYKFIQRHPILNIVLVILFRAILNHLHMRKALIYRDWLITQEVLRILSHEFNISIQIIQQGIYKFKNNTIICEDNQNIYFSLIDQQNKEWQKHKIVNLQANEQFSSDSNDFKVNLIKQERIRYYPNKNNFLSSYTKQTGKYQNEQPSLQSRLYSKQLYKTQKQKYENNHNQDNFNIPFHFRYSQNTKLIGNQKARFISPVKNEVIDRNIKFKTQINDHENGGYINLNQGNLQSRYQIYDRNSDINHFRKSQNYKINLNNRNFHSFNQQMSNIGNTTERNKFSNTQKYKTPNFKKDKTQFYLQNRESINPEIHFNYRSDNTQPLIDQNPHKLIKQINQFIINQPKSQYNNKLSNIVVHYESLPIRNK